MHQSRSVWSQIFINITWLSFKEILFYDYKHLWPDRPMLVHFILLYKFLVTYIILYRNGVAQTEISVK